MKRIVSLALLMTLLLGLIGSAVIYAQDTDTDAEVTPEATEEVDMDMDSESEDMDSEDDMDDDHMVEIINLDGNFEGDTSFVRFLHFVPGDVAADVYINGELSDTAGLEYTHSGNWIVVPSGDHTVAVTAAGDSVDNAFWSNTVNLPANEPVFVAVVGNGEGESPTVVVVTDDYGEVLPSVGTINFVNAMSDDTGVNLLRDDVVFIAGIPSPEGDVVTVNNSIPVDAGEYTFSLTVAGTDEAITDEDAMVELDVRDEDNYLLVAAGTASDPHLIVYHVPQAQVDLMRGEIEAPGTVLDVLRAQEGYDDLLTWIDDAGLTDTLNGEGPFTIFVPAPHLMDELSGYEYVAAVLQNHVVAGDYRSGDILFDDIGSVDMVGGANFTLGESGDNLMIGDAEIIEVNHMATNGVVHMINAILVPADAGE